MEIIQGWIHLWDACTYTKWAWGEVRKETLVHSRALNISVAWCLPTLSQRCENPKSRKYE